MLFSEMEQSRLQRKVVCYCVDKRKEGIERWPEKQEEKRNNKLLVGEEKKQKKKKKKNVG